MGQIFDKLQGKEWRRKQIKRITDKIFDLVKNDVERAPQTLRLQPCLYAETYLAALYRQRIFVVDINKHLPGPHFDPPSKDRVRSMIKDCDVNLDGEIDREEFVRFFQRLTSDTIIVVIQPLVATLAVAPTVAMAAKRTAEGVPGVAKVVRKLPDPVYASLVTLAVLLFQKSIQGV